MRPRLQAVIRPLTQSDLREFFRYLNDQLSDNGTEEAGYFQPVPRKNSRLEPGKARSFRKGLAMAIGAPGWRRAWIARGVDRQIIGHVDLRAHSELYAGHRCLLGMGVQRDHRGIGLGRRLVAHAMEWAKTKARLEWIDLEVLSANHRAVQLYKKVGFLKTGEIPEMFKLDGHLITVTSMSRRIRRTANRRAGPTAVRG